MIHKICTKCEEKKPITDYSPNKSVKDGYQSNCKKCHNLISKIYGKTKKGRNNYKKNSCKFRNLNRDKLNRKRVEYAKKYPKRIRANNMVFYYLKKGSIKKSTCEICGVKKVTAHHSNYNEPLKVNWLCAIHHKEWHKNNQVLD